jgi:hypothetical protein
MLDPELPAALLPGGLAPEPRDANQPLANGGQVVRYLVVCVAG